MSTQTSDIQNLTLKNYDFREGVFSSFEQNFMKAWTVEVKKPEGDVGMSPDVSF